MKLIHSFIHSFIHISLLTALFTAMGTTKSGDFYVKLSLKCLDNVVVIVHNNAHLKSMKKMKIALYQSLWEIHTVASREALRALA